MIDVEMTLEDKLINFLYTQTGIDQNKLEKDNILDLNGLFNNNILYFETLMNIIKYKYFPLANILKISVLIQLKNFLSKFLKDKKKEILCDLEQNCIYIIELLCNIDKDRKIKSFLKIIIMSMIGLNLNYLSNKTSRGTFNKIFRKFFNYNRQIH